MPETNQELQNLTYNGAYFEKNGKMWSLDIRVNNRNEIINLMFRYNPLQVENISISNGVSEYIKSKDKLYLTTQEDIGSIPVIGMSNLGRAVGSRSKIFNIETHGALTTKNKGHPHITCKNSTESTGVVWYKLADKTEVSLQDSCVLVEGKTNWELVRASDRIIYELLDIM